MDIRKLQPEAEVTYEIETSGDKPITIKFRVKFIALDTIPDYVKESMKPKGPVPRLSDVVRKTVSEAIVAWDLTDGEEPLPCTPENKEKHLPLIFGLKVKQPNVDAEKLEEDPAAQTVVRALAEFASDAENFLKN